MIQRGDLVHSFYLSRPRPGAEDDPDAIDWIGHATSSDLINWKEERPAIPPGPAGSLDDMKPWTGHVCERGGEYYLYYTGRSRAEGGSVQRTMLATSSDLYTWMKHPVPVMAPDPRWYVSEEEPGPDGRVGWRDPVIVLDEKTGWFHAFLASHIKEGEVAERGCVAHAKSQDLLSWEVLEPAFAPRRYATIEVPDVFFLGSHWYMTLLTGTAYGNARGSFSDPNIEMGTMFAVSDSLDKPFRELDDNVLIGARWWEGTSCRSVDFQGNRFLFYFQCERRGGHDCGDVCWGVLTTPKLLATTPEGYLRAQYSPLIERAAMGRLLEEFPSSLRDEVNHFGLGVWQVSPTRVAASCRSGWSTAITTETGGDFVLSLRVAVSSGRAAGALFHANGPDAGYVVLLDFHAQELMLTRLRQFDKLEARRVSLLYGHSYHLRVVCKGCFYEVYLDDILLINCVRYAWPTGQFGLIVEQGAASFEAIDVVQLKIA